MDNEIFSLATTNRSTYEDVLKQNKFIKSFDYVNEILDALPHITFIINQNRQIIFANSYLLETIGMKVDINIIGARPGELLHCVNSNISRDGCGTSNECRDCLALLTILDSRLKKSKVTKDVQIKSRINNKDIYWNFSLTAYPFKKLNDAFTIISLIDISQIQHKKVLESIFFHDILNSAGAISSYIKLIKDFKDINSIKEHINSLYSTSVSLVEQIKSQKILTSAENKDLYVKNSQLSSLSFLENIVELLKSIVVDEEKILIIDENSENIDFFSDVILLERILINLIKNALEASQQGDVINIGCYKELESVIFYVSNPAYIPEDIQEKIFQKTFSTKGNGRGQGTYSINLLTENYLNGKAWFKSVVNTGTTFFISIPVVPKDMILPEE